jgi:hypothetical protein
MPKLFIDYSNFTDGIMDSADESGGGTRYKLPGGGCPEGSPGLYCIAYVFVFIGSFFICRFTD